MITVFTPTYNREKYLKTLYKSLLKQTNKNFVWLIVNDGSTDKSEELIKEFISEKKIKIEYYYQKNQGKHIAYNKAVVECKTPFFLCVDSDDTLTEDAIEELYKFIDKIDDTIWAVIGPKVRNDMSLSGEWKCKDNTRTKLIDLYQKFNYVGETYILMNSKIAKQYLFPKFEGEKLIPENVIYNDLDNKFDILTMSKPIYLYEYQDDGYSNNSLKTFSRSLCGSCYSNLKIYQCKYSNFKNKIISLSRYRAIKKIFKLNHELLNTKINLIYYVLSYPVYLIMCKRYNDKKKILENK